ncbi:MAG: hypothetical protein LUQ22_02805 [Methanotrichaceae archaeon]|nr:hypothetical protein [Methanotrichaceae archaeon]
MGADKSFILQDLQRKCIRDIRKVCVKQAEDSGYIITVSTYPDRVAPK